ncbi:MAG: DUF2796 domain-containing protein [Zoogloeaceae bacterium]|jgi:hypothetical protein|nr:DUF2796 domain-containing protein [Zoogloeaceae bacterium]
MKQGICTTIAFCACGLLGATASSVLAQEHAAHVHGEAHLDMALEGTALSLQLESPLDNLLGFERAPGNPAEEDKAKRMSATLRAADRLFALTPAAGCALEKVTLESSALTAELLGEAGNATEREHEHEHGAPHEHDDEDEAGHADLDASWQFHCARPEALRAVEIRLFHSFPGLHTLRVRAATPKGQRGATLTPENRTLTW